MEPERTLDVLAQQPFLRKLYTQICLCYPIPSTNENDEADAAITHTLIKGLRRLSEAFPWIACQTTTHSAGDGASGISKLARFEAAPRFIIQDLREVASATSMEDLRNARFPFSMLDESLVAPYMTLSAGMEYPAPVFAVQANFIRGGLLLCFVSQHNVMDMTGQARMMHLLSKACHDIPFTKEDLTAAEFPKPDVIPLLDESYQLGPELRNQIVKLATTDVPAAAEAPKSRWVYFGFSSSSLSSLKGQASKSLTTPVEYISTDDALSALIWQAVTRARLPRLDRSQSTTFARAIDVRRFVGAPVDYPGMLQNMTYHTFPIEKLASMPLGEIASDFRAALLGATDDIPFRTRALATAMHRASDKATLNVTACVDPARDISFSSWAQMDMYGLDFNLGLGTPEAVRRPAFVPFESLMYLMPKRADGEIVAGMCLREEDIERLKADGEFGKHAKFIG